MFYLAVFIAVMPSLACGYVTAKRILYQSSLKCGQVNEHSSIFIFGLGYVGLSIASKLRYMGCKVSGTCTNINKMKSLRELGINAYLFNDFYGEGKLTENDARNDLLTSSHIITTIAPTLSSNGDPVLKGHGIDLREVSLNTNNCNSKLKWLGYISSTGVYGDRGGEWVHETDKLNPESMKSKMRLQAEMAWRSLYQRNDLPVHIFRVAGIYGPGRNALDTLLKAEGDMNQCGPDNITYISRIHLSDLTNVIIASMNNPSPGLILNVADDMPSTRFDVLVYSCHLMNYPSQKEKPDKKGEPYSSRGGSKRVDNSKMKLLLKSANIELLYPDYKSGLSAIHML